MKLEILSDIFFSAVERDRPRVMAYKQGGQWRNISSSELYRQVHGVARALESWGVRKGDRVAILSENRPEWQMADFAILLLGAVDVPVYTTLTAEQIEYLMQDSGARYIFVSTPGQLRRLLSIKTAGLIERIIIMDDLPAGEGGAAMDRERVVSFASLTDAESPPANERRDALFDARGHSLHPSDLATIIYTSGTTGTPKGVMLTHGNVACNVSLSLKLYDIGPNDVTISYLPLSHITARHIDYAYLHHGVTVAYCPNFDDLPQTLLDVRPTLFVGVPRVFEKTYSKVQREVGSGVKRRLYDWAMAVGRAHLDDTLAGRIPRGWRWRLADFLLFRHVRDGFGGRVRAFSSGGAPLGRELATWYASIGINIYEGYGLTETSPIIAVNTPPEHRLGTVGKVLSNVQAKIADDGELLVRGPNVFQGYWNLPEETKNAFVDGWFKTGDIASLDADGFLTITDRKKDLIKTSGGKFIAPQPLETSLKSNSLVAQAAIIGDRRKFPAVLISPNFSELGDWARAHQIDFSAAADLVRDPRVVALYQEIVGGLNQNLAQYEKLKKVLLVPNEFSIASGELTPSMKLKRRVVEQKYRREIDALYAEEPAKT
jgi:long-chain acyl-CoA synthetase